MPGVALTSLIPFVFLSLSPWTFPLYIIVENTDDLWNSVKPQQIYNEVLLK